MWSLGMLLWMAIMCQRDSAGTAMDSQLSFRLTRSWISKIGIRFSSLELMFTMRSAGQLCSSIRANGRALSRGLEDGLILRMPIGLWTRVSWSLSGGSSDKSSIRIWFTEDAKSCLILTDVWPSYPTSKLSKTTRMFLILRLSLLSLWSAILMLAWLHGLPLLGPSLPTWLCRSILTTLMFR
jgi:hypothetical protein